ncbi:hypothetical protein FQN54_004993 [Arachnomyces sp. PD_36]|nr:hypothetical protein FQN54_004993 [Arachnomyces sp. PD_36]
MAPQKRKAAGKNDEEAGGHPAKAQKVNDDTESIDSNHDLETEGLVPNPDYLEMLLDQKRAKQREIDHLTKILKRVAEKDKKEREEKGKDKGKGKGKGTRRKKTDPEEDHSVLVRNRFLLDLQDGKRTGNACTRCAKKKMACSYGPGPCTNCRVRGLPCENVEKTTFEIYQRGDITRLRNEVVRLRQERDLYKDAYLALGKPDLIDRAESPIPDGPAKITEFPERPPKYVPKDPDPNKKVHVTTPEENLKNGRGPPLFRREEPKSTLNIESQAKNAPKKASTPRQTPQPQQTPQQSQPVNPGQSRQTTPLPQAHQYVQPGRNPRYPHLPQLQSPYQAQQPYQQQPVFRVQRQGAPPIHIMNYGQTPVQGYAAYQNIPSPAAVPYYDPAQTQQPYHAGWQGARHSRGSGTTEGEEAVGLVEDDGDEDNEDEEEEEEEEEGGLVEDYGDDDNGGEDDDDEDGDADADAEYDLFDTYQGPEDQSGELDEADFTMMQALQAENQKPDVQTYYYNDPSAVPSPEE